MTPFTDVQPSLDNYWRAIILFGRNVAAYKFALGKTLLGLEGTAPACRLLLRRLVLVAGERDISGWFPAGRPDVLRMAEEVGFRRQFRDDSHGRPAYLYYWSRNEDVGGPRGE
jgi:hypothetical protein